MSRTQTWIIVGLIGLFWGLNWPAVKTLLTEIPPFTIRAVALTAAGALLTLVVWISGHRLRPQQGELWPLLMAGLLTVFAFNVLVTFGQLLTETSKAAIIAYIMPALTALFSVIFLKERLGMGRLLALIIGMTGIGVMASENLDHLIANPLGPLLMAASATAWALGIVATKARTWSITPMAQAVWFLLPSGILCWPFALAIEAPWSVPWPSPLVTALMAWHILCPMLIAYAVWTSLVGHLPASVAALATLLAPVVAVSSSIILLGDPATWQKLLALALICASIMLTLLPGGPSAHRAWRRNRD
ncbi:MAG: DMT family transporter [Pseudomonadota bacterium]